MKVWTWLLMCCVAAAAAGPVPGRRSFQSVDLKRPAQARHFEKAVLSLQSPCRTRLVRVHRSDTVPAEYFDVVCDRESRRCTQLVVDLQAVHVVDASDGRLAPYRHRILQKVGCVLVDVVASSKAGLTLTPRM